MNNAEIKSAMLRLLQIKSLKDEEVSLKESIIKEMNKRNKKEINLSTGETIRLSESDVLGYRPIDVLWLFLKSEYPNMNIEKTISFDTEDIEKFLSMVSIVKKSVKDKLGNNVFERIKPISCSKRKYLHYSVGTEIENNKRDIDF